MEILPDLYFSQFVVICILISVPIVMIKRIKNHMDTKKYNERQEEIEAEDRKIIRDNKDTIIEAVYLYKKLKGYTYRVDFKKLISASLHTPQFVLMDHHIYVALPTYFSDDDIKKYINDKLWELVEEKKIDQDYQIIKTRDCTQLFGDLAVSDYENLIAYSAGRLVSSFYEESEAWIVVKEIERQIGLDGTSNFLN